MTITESKITRQGQVTVPAEVRRRLGVTPGCTLEWLEVEGQIVVRRAAKFDSAQIHAAVFPTTPERRTLDELDEGVRERMRLARALD